VDASVVVAALVDAVANGRWAEGPLRARRLARVGLRHNLTTYDASYVALAECLGAEFATGSDAR
jgi:predicted nucleic acid-binding protein